MEWTTKEKKLRKEEEKTCIGQIGQTLAWCPKDNIECARQISFGRSEKANVFLSIR